MRDRVRRAEPGSIGRWWPLAWRAAVTVTVLALLFHFLPTDELLGAMRRAGAARWLTLLVALVGLQAVAAAKWRLLVRACVAPVAYVDVLEAHGAGLFANNFLPSLVGGDVVRGGLLARRGIGAEGLLVSLLADRAVDASSLVLLAAVGGLLVPGELDPGAARVMIVASSMLLVGLFVGPILVARLPVRWLPERLRGIVHEVRTALSALMAHPKRALAALGLALSIQTSLIGLNWLLGGAMGIEAGFSIWLLTWPLAKLVALMPVSLGGIGVRQVALAALMTPFGVAAAGVVAQSLIWESLLLGLGLVGGGISLWLGSLRPAPVPGAYR